MLRQVALVGSSIFVCLSDTLIEQVLPSGKAVITAGDFSLLAGSSLRGWSRG